MKKKTKKIILGSVLACLLFGIAGVAHIYYYFFAQPFQITDTTYIYIDRDDDVDSVYHKIAEAGNPKQMHGFESLVRYQGYNIKTGRYAIKPTDNMRYLHRRLSMGYQTPVKLTIGSHNGRFIAQIRPPFLLIIKDLGQKRIFGQMCDPLLGRKGKRGQQQAKNGNPTAVEKLRSILHIQSILNLC